MIDELHMLDDDSRGYILELMGTKLLSLEQNVQIVGMSATLNVSSPLLALQMLLTDVSECKCASSVVGQCQILYIKISTGPHRRTFGFRQRRISSLDREQLLQNGHSAERPDSIAKYNTAKTEFLSEHRSVAV